MYIPYREFDISDKLYFDNFDSYALGSTLDGQGGWASVFNSIQVHPSYYSFRGLSSYSLHWKPDSLTETDDQVAGIDFEILQATGADVGIALRVNPDNGGTAYVYMINSTTTYFGRWLEGSYLNLASGGHSETTGTLSMEVEGNTIRCYLNGELNTALTGGTGIFTNTAIPTGKGVGIYVYQLGYAIGDNWYAHDL
jgi:hypothetical protein